jgi:hypothetical protein
MSRNARARTPTSRGRRIALSFGTAVGAAVVAASISMGTPPVAGADGSDADAISHLAGALDSNAVSAAGVPDVDAISHLIEAFDPNPFSSSGAPTDAIGLLGYGLDTYLLGPTGLGDALDPIVDDWLSSLPSGAASAASVLDADPVSDLIGAVDPSAFSTLGAPTDVLGELASGLDPSLLVPTGLGAALDPIIDGLVGAGTLF